MKRKVNMNRPELSSEEIAKRKNFEPVLKQGNTVGKPFFKKPWFLTSLAVATVAVVSSLVLVNLDRSPEPVAEMNAPDQSSDSLALEAFYKAEEAKPCIAPPLDGLNIPYTVFKVNAEKGGTLQFKTGSLLKVPANAFRDSNGKPLKGEVELRYREFHDGVDIFLAGIPMTYDSAGSRYHFESAGMMEILAYQDGKEVAMAEGKNINVELASKQEGTKYNLYKLDTLHNNWSCLGKDKVVSAKPSLQPAQKENDIKRLPEFAEVEVRKEEALKEKQSLIAALPKPAPEPLKPAKARKGKYTFNLDIDPLEFPELNVYKGLLFEVGDENTSFSPETYKITWEDVTIKEGNKKGTNYLLTLKKGMKKQELIVYPVFEGKDYETALKDYQDKFNRYNAVLEKRKADEKKLEAEYEAKLADLRKQQAEIERKWKEKSDEEFRSMDTQAKVTRVFRINSFGVYNCDNPAAYPKGVLSNATLTKEKNKKLECFEVYLVDRQRNAIFTYERNPLSSFSFDPAAENILWTVEHGVLFYLKPEDFAGIKGGNQRVEMKRVEQKFRNAEEMKTFFSI